MPHPLLACVVYHRDAGASEVRRNLRKEVGQGTGSMAEGRFCGAVDGRKGASMRGDLPLLADLDRLPCEVEVARNEHGVEAEATFSVDVCCNSARAGAVAHQRAMWCMQAGHSTEFSRAQARFNLQVLALEVGQQTQDSGAPDRLQRIRGVHPGNPSSDVTNNPASSTRIHASSVGRCALAWSIFARATVSRSSL